MFLPFVAEAMAAARIDIFRADAEGIRSANIVIFHEKRSPSKSKNADVHTGSRFRMYGYAAKAFRNMFRKAFAACGNPVVSLYLTMYSAV